MELLKNVLGKKSENVVLGRPYLHETPNSDVRSQRLRPCEGSLLRSPRDDAYLVVLPEIRQLHAEASTHCRAAVVEGRAPP
eukprot:scaffold388_cov380-Prasinococcus_capsulatus_cf.AAC.37